MAEGAGNCPTCEAEWRVGPEGRPTRCDVCGGRIPPVSADPDSTPEVMLLDDDASASVKRVPTARRVRSFDDLPEAKAVEDTRYSSDTNENQFKPKTKHTHVLGVFGVVVLSMGCGFSVIGYVLWIGFKTAGKHAPAASNSTPVDISTRLR